MKRATDNIDRLFQRLDGNFDLEHPALGHQNRFLNRLGSDAQASVKAPVTFTRRWMPYLAAAASVIIMLAVLLGTNFTDNGRSLGSVSAEMAQTEDFYTTTITRELERLQEEAEPEYQHLVVDALFQIELLEQNYQQLKLDLEKSGDNQQVIHAMILNFQDRIDLLQNVLDQIEQVKQLKNEEYENSATL